MFSNQAHIISNRIFSNVKKQQQKLFLIDPIRGFLHPLNKLIKLIGSISPHHMFFDNFFISSFNQSFDDLLFPDEHESKTTTHSYLFNEDFLLRPHMTSSERKYIKMGHRDFCIIGKVFRKDEIDSTHFPCFYQLENVKIFENSGTCTTKDILDDLKTRILKIVKTILGKEIEFRFTETIFPFTSPSIELEVFNGKEWIELLGGGILNPKVYKGFGDNAWAFGVGLERLLMLQKGIKDIRSIWDKTSYLNSDQLRFRDISIWLSNYENINQKYELSTQIEIYISEYIKPIQIQIVSWQFLFICPIYRLMSI